ncbi:MAG: PKD domain-containing protein [Methanomassiliicoccales archaeon]
MKASSRTRMFSVIILTAFILIPAFQAPSSGAESALSVTYEFDFSEPYVDMDTPERLYAISGLEVDGRGGVPALPLRSLFLAIPPGHELIDVEVKCAPPRVIGSMQQYPINPAEIALSGDLSFSYEYSGLPYGITSSYQLEGVEVIGLDLRPLFWDEDSGVLSFVSGYTITLIYEQGGTDYIGDMDRVRDLVDNPQAVPDVPRSTSSSLLPAGEYEHLIITSQELSAPFLGLAEWKGERNQLGSVHLDIRSKVVTLEDILANGDFWGEPRSHGNTGNDTQTIIRNFIIAAHQEWGVDYVLLGGDDDVIPVRMLVAPMYNTDYDELPGDIYYSGLDGTWDSDGDGAYGELLGILGSDEADLLGEVFVGRATVSTVGQAWNFVNKTIGYEMGYSNQYADDFLLIGEKLDDEPTYGDDYKEEVWNLVLADQGLDRSTLYAEDGTFSGSAVLAAMDSDVHVINHMGHGNFVNMAGLYNYNVQGLDNELPFILYTQACMVAGFDEKADAPGDCIAEEFVQGEGGTVAFIGNSRFGWYSPGSTAGSSQKFDISFFSQVYDDDVTDLGRALSYSKEEWAVSASSGGTVRWVYLELNLLGDPETRVHVPERAVHDLAVMDVSVDRPLLGEACPVAVRVQNQGQSDDVGTLRLLADGVEIGNASISLGPGMSVTIPMEWTPDEHSTVTITAQLVCAEDQRPENDLVSVLRMVNRRVVSDETWTGNRTLTGGLLIEPLVTVDIADCDLTLQTSALPYRLSVQGSLSINSSTVEGSPFFFDSVGGDLFIMGSHLAGMSAASVSTLSSGSLTVRDAVIDGGAGWRSNGTMVSLYNATFIDQAGEWYLSNSSAAIDRLEGHRGDGMRLWNMTGAVTSSSWTGGSSGLSIERCAAMTLRDLSFQGNGMDMGIFGDERVHFEHDLENVSLTYGPLRVLLALDGETLENATGSLYLVGCNDIVVRSSLFKSVGNGLALIDSSNVEMAGNSFENCSVGLLAIDSDGIAWGNDLLFNERQATLVRSNITFGKEYPIGGNHWSDIVGTDTKNGENQDLAGADGMFDAAYDAGDIYDRYPKVQRCSLTYDLPVASFTMDAAQANRADALGFTSTSYSGIGIANWTWDLGDGHLAYRPSVTHTYGSLGTVVVNLTITDHHGRIDSSERTVLVVNLEPLCDFRFTPIAPAPGETVRFQDLSSDRDGSIASWQWNFGDGNISDQVSPEHVFVNEGNYLVSLTVNDADGGSDTVSHSLAVGNEPPVAAFTWNPTSVTTLVDVLFASTSSDPDGTITSWTWDFGDGTWGSGSTVKHRYYALGTYSVTLAVTDEDGGSDSLTRSLTVLNSRPVAAFTAPAEVESLLDVKFEDHSYDLDGSLTSWSWSFGDGETSNERSPTHAYQRPGIFTIDLTVTDDRNWMSMVSSSITVINRLPTVNMTLPQGEHWSLDVLEFIASGQDPDGTVISYSWDMGDGTVLEGSNVTHAYLEPGIYNVTVTCQDDSGGEAVNASEIIILNLLPRAAVRQEQGDHPLELVFTALAEDDDGEIVSYNWSFGDGTFGAGASAVHKYYQQGSYDIVLTITDDAGGAAEAQDKINVSMSSILLSSAELSFDKQNGWTLSGEIFNDGEIPVQVTLFVDAGGMWFLKEYNITAGSSTSFVLTLTNFEQGNVTVKVLTPDGWDSNLQDNEWATYVEPGDTFPYWLVGLAIAAMAVVLIAMYIWREE